MKDTKGGGSERFKAAVERFRGLRCGQRFADGSRGSEEFFLRLDDDEARRWLVIYGSESSARVAAAKLPGDEGVQAELNERFPPGE